MHRSRFFKKAWLLWVGLLALVVHATFAGPLMADCSPEQRAEAPALAVNETGEIDGVTYVIKVPEDWNGKLLVYAHGYGGDDPPVPSTLVPKAIRVFVDGDDSLENCLLHQGYALAASRFSNAGWAIKEGIEDNKKLVLFFRKHIGHPTRTILWGSSMGSGVALKSAEINADLYDGVIALSHIGAGTTTNMDYALDVAVAFDAAFGWPTELWGPLEDINDDLVPEGNDHFRIGFAFFTKVVPVIAQTFVTPDGFAKWEFIRLVNDLPLDGFYTGNVGFDNWLASMMFFATVARAELESRAGGPIVQNVNHVYSLSPEDRFRLQAVRIDDSTADALLEAMNNRPKITAKPSARNYLRRFADFNGTPRQPVLTVTPVGDGLTIPANSTLYQQTLEESGHADLVVQKFTNVNKHVGFNTDQVLALFAAMEYWLDTGLRPGNDMFPEDLDFDNDFEPPAWPSVAP